METASAPAMPAQREFRVFISAVSGELKSCRGEVARVLRRKELEVRDQEHFRQGPATLLEQLAAYIEKCDAVILLIGERAGAFPSDEQAAALGAVPIFQQYCRETAQSRASYTQWEFLLAKHHRKLTYLFFTGDGFEPDGPNGEAAEERACQAAYRQWIEHRGEHWDALATKAKLIEDVLVLPFPDLSRAKPIYLPYSPLGRLFKGRNGFLQELHRSLTRGAGRAAIVGSALCGLGGIGKTRVAVEYAWAHRDEYTALLFVIAETPEALRRNLAALAGPLVLNLPEQKVDEEEVRIKATLDWLKNHPGWFLIFDNLDTPEAQTEVERLLGRLSGGHVVVTSRLTNFAGNFEPLALDVLTADDAAAFLLERTAGRRQNSDNDAQAARSLAVELGQLALALEQAGAYIARLGLSFARYRQLWHENWQKVAGWTDERITQYPRSVAVTWQTSVNRVGIAARRLLERLAWLAPEPVPDFLLEVPISGIAADDLGEALADLADYSLVRRNPDRQEFSVHRLVQDVTRRSLSGEDAHTALQQALAWLDAAFTGDARDLRVRPKMERLAPHIRAVAEHGYDAGIAAPTARLCLRLADLFREHVTLAQTDQLCRRALALFERLAQSDSSNAGWQRDLSESYIKVGDVQEAQGDLAGALQSYRDSLAIIERLAQSDPGNAGWQRDLSVSYERVGYVQEAQGDLAGALKSYRDSLAIFERLAQSDPGNAGWQHGLSASYSRVGDVQHAQGDLAGALKSYRDSLAIMERLAQSDPGNAGWQHGLSVALSRVGDVQQAQGDLAGALKSYRDGLAISERLAQSDPSNAGWQSNLSVSYSRVGDVQQPQGDLAGALKFYRDSLAIFERLAQSDPSNAGSQSNLSWALSRVGNVQVALGDLAGALKSYRDGLAIFDRLAQSDTSNAGWQHGLSASYSRVGDVQQAQGDLAGALKSYRGSLAISKRLASLDRSNKQWQAHLGGLAYGFVKARDFTTALAVADQAISLAPDQMWLYTNRAHALMFLDRTDEARALYLKYRGQKEVQKGKSWEIVILEDFADIRKARLTNPLMDEVEKLFAS
jgi:tetratricopeptide (TPR) repeat protein